MEENYTAGELGVIFNTAVPLSIPIVVQLLRQRRDSEDENDKAKALIQGCREQLEILQEGCTNEAVVHELLNRRLRLRSEHDDSSNAHLANIMVDANGNVIFPEGRSSAGNDNDDETDKSQRQNTRRREKMKPFEVIALSTLTPKTAEEAMVLVPSLSRFDASDLQDALVMLEQEKQHARIDK